MVKKGFTTAASEPNIEYFPTAPPRHRLTCIASPSVRQKQPQNSSAQRILYAYSHHAWCVSEKKKKKIADEHSHFCVAWPFSPVCQDLSGWKTAERTREEASVTTTTAHHLTVGFECDRLRELSRHGLITCFHSERDVAGVKAQTCEYRQSIYVHARVIIIIIFFYTSGKTTSETLVVVVVLPVSVCSSSRIPSSTIQG